MHKICEKSQARKIPHFANTFGASAEEYAKVCCECLLFGSAENDIVTPDKEKFAI